MNESKPDWLMKEKLVSTTVNVDSNLYKDLKVKLLTEGIFIQNFFDRGISFIINDQIPFLIEKAPERTNKKITFRLTDNERKQVKCYLVEKEYSITDFVNSYIKSYLR